MTTSKEIQNEMLSNVSDDYDKTVGSFIYDVTKPVAIELENFNNKLEIVKGKLSIDNLKNDELTARVYELTGIERRTATKATGIITVFGSDGSAIRVGDKVSTNDINYTFMENKVITSGQALVKVECDLFGVIGNVPSNTITNMPVTLSGITSVTNLEPLTGGYEEETDESLLERYYERIRTPATSNNKYHFRNWTKEVVGVGNVRVFPLWNGDNTVKVVIIDSNMQPASQELVESVQNHIDPGGLGLGEGQSSFGSFCTVVSAIAKEIDISVTINKELDYPQETIKENVESAITNYLKGIAYKQTFVSHAQIGAIILDCEGVIDYSNLLINGDSVNIDIKDKEISILGGVTIA